MSIPKIPADGFMIFNGPFGFAIGVQQAEFPAFPEGNPGRNTGQVPLVVVEEIRISPQVAKMLLMSLAQNLRGYEEQYGEIPEPPMPPGRTN